MEIYEITGFKTGVSQEGVNFLQPSDSFQNIQNGFIYRQVLQSRKGFRRFSKGWYNSDPLVLRHLGRLPTRVTGIFENVLTSTSTTETLFFDQNFAYKYSEATDEMVRIPFAGSLAPFVGFGLTNKEDFISGTTYPDKNGANRFIFTGRNMPGVFFYNGTDIRSWTSIADNIDYQAFVASGGGALTLNRAVHVFWFGERINFVVPTLTARVYPQGMLYSAIRDADGSGDKFNTSGAGLLEIDTYELIKGATIHGNMIFLNASRSNWTIEKTRDVFNPYYSRKIPSQIGTDASFSAVAWDNEVISVGRTGILTTDGRQTLRIDTKIPTFTDTQIESLDFEQTYGGFDRNNGQFLWTYVDAKNEALTADKVLVKSYEEKSWAINDQRFSCFGQSLSGQKLNWNQIGEAINPAWERWNTTEETWNKIGIGKETQKTLAGDDFGFVYELNQDYDDYYTAITGMTNAVNTVVTTEDNAFIVGDIVIIENVFGMVDGGANNGVNGSECQVVARTDNSVTLNLNTSQLGVYISGGSLSKPIVFSAETIPFNPYRENGQRCRIAYVEFLMDTDGGSLLVDVYMDGEDTPFKKDVMLQPISTLKDREWVDLIINNNADFMTLVLKQKSVNNQVKITSIRIHCEEGGS